LEQKTYFNRDDLTIHIWMGDDYFSFDAQECVTGSQLLDWIFYIRAKQWGTHEVLDGFLDCIDQTCQTIFGKSAQVAFCPSGNNQRVDWLKGTIERIEEKEKAA
jgi:hypothetical protein